MRGSGDGRTIIPRRARAQRPRVCGSASATRAERAGLVAVGHRPRAGKRARDARNGLPADAEPSGAGPPTSSATRSRRRARRLVRLIATARARNGAARVRACRGEETERGPRARAAGRPRRRPEARAPRDQQPGGAPRREARARARCCRAAAPALHWQGRRPALAEETRRERRVRWLAVRIDAGCRSPAGEDRGEQPP